MIATMETTNKKLDKATLFFCANQVTRLSRIASYIMMAMMLCVFINPDFQIFTGPILTVCFIYLYLNGQQALVTAVIITANDALGCVAFGVLSFPYLLGALFVLTIAKDGMKLRIKKHHIIAFSVMLFMLIVLAVSGDINVKMIVYTVTFICTMSSCLKSSDGTEMLFKGIAITVFLIAIHTCISGGVEFYELAEGSKEFLRKGILGVGLADSNFSALLLNVGVICTLFDKDFRWHTKTVMVIVSTLAMTVTLSMSGIVGLLLSLIGFALIRRDSMSKKMARVVFIIVGVVVIAAVYTQLPKSMRNETIDAYIERVEEKINFLNMGDMDGFTTLRSDKFNERIEFIFEEQDAGGIFFGFNSLTAGSEDESVPHNTYVDLLLRIGVLGTLIVLSFVVWKLIKSCKNPNGNRRDVLLKLLFLYYFMSLSIYQGSIFALAYMSLIVL